MIKNPEKSKSYGEFIVAYKEYLSHYEQARKLLLLIKKSDLSLYEKALQKHLDALNVCREMISIIEEMIDMV